MEDSDYRTIKLFSAAIVLVSTLVILGLAVTGNLTTAYEYLQEAVYRGDGTIDVEVMGPDQNSRMMAQNSTGIDISYTKQTSVDARLLTVEYNVDNGDGSRRTKFVYQAQSKDAGVGGEIFFNNINGSFSATSTSSLTVDEGTGLVTFDLENTITGESAKLHGRIYNTDSGKPLEGERLGGAGNWSIWQHINKTVTPDAPLEAWLELCNSVNHDMILDPSVPDGTYILPEGSYLADDGLLHPVPEGQKMIDGVLYKVAEAEE